MEFITYIINLKRDKERYSDISKSLSRLDMKHVRFDAIYGDDIYDEYDEYLTTFAKYFAPGPLIGCGLSHYILNRYIYDNDDNDFALILEDDARPVFDSKNKIEEVILDAPQDWEIILLYCQGICNYKGETYNVGKYNASNMAYLINKKGIKAQYMNRKLLTHVDAERILTNVKVYKSPSPLFYSNEKYGSLTSTENNYGPIEDIVNDTFNTMIESEVTKTSAANFLRYKVIRVPFIDVSLDSYQLGMILIVVIVLVVLKFLCII